MSYKSGSPIELSVEIIHSDGNGMEIGLVCHDHNHDENDHVLSSNKSSSSSIIRLPSMIPVAEIKILPMDHFSIDWVEKGKFSSLEKYLFFIGSKVYMFDLFLLQELRDYN
jgi:hypothetical protein